MAKSVVMFVLVLFPVLASLFWGLLGAHAVRIKINPEKCTAVSWKEVHFSCIHDDDDSEDMVFKKIELSRNNEERIAFVSWGDNITVRSDIPSQFQAAGHISEGNGTSYLDVTLQHPKSEDTGIYTCVLYYLDKSGGVKKETSSGNLEVEKLDMNSLNDVLTNMKDTMTAMEKNNIGLQVQVTVLAEAHKSQYREMTDLKEKVTILENANRTHTKQIRRLTEKALYRTAFSVSNENSSLMLVNGGVILLPDLIMKIGSGYDEKTGMFTAPAAGLYAFHLVARSSKASDCVLELLTNDKVLARLYAFNKDVADQSSVSSVIDLCAGDVVLVVSRSKGCSLQKDLFTVFTGYLITSL